jgi:transcriptional regulator NrdR family protein
MSLTPITCPFCDSPDIEAVSAWGGQLITRQLRCRSCRTHFEALRPEFDAEGDEPSTSS